ncbi:hypothetical protein JCM33374_g2894 [Metschnikowia sp. JCM 33374]|nr:hypothetical protein JCM33374_g2894 [Metschnikowia sp. JCM 33374]
MYFGSRWNVLITRPEYVAQVIRNNNIFEKSGNSEKIPHAVVSEFLGDNVISAGNARWRQYRDVVTNSILFPNTASLDARVDELVSVCAAQSKKGTVRVNDVLQRFFLASIGDCVLGCDLDSSTDTFSILDRIRYLKTQIFRPVYMAFPILDKLPIPSRVHAKAQVKEFKALIRSKILQERCPENADRLGSQLATAHENGDLTQKQFEDNAIIALVAGHENPEMLLATVLYLLSKYPEVQHKLRDQLKCLDPSQKESLPYLHAVIFECLRLYPPIGQLANRITRQKVCLGRDILIPKGVYIGTNSFITQRDRAIWEDADKFLPQRWGTTEKEIMAKYNLAKSRCELTAFHGRNRACLGEKFALMEVRKCVVAILENFEFSLDPAWKEQITPAGPIWPVQLSLAIKTLHD